MFGAERLTLFHIRVIRSSDLNTVHETCLRDKSVSDTSCSDYTERNSRSLLTELSAGYPFGSRKVYYLAVLFQIIEIPGPVRTDCEDIDSVFLDIIYLLSLIFLDDNLIG